MKICLTCKISKNESEFYSDKRNRCGLDSYCKKCHNKRVCEYAKTPKGKDIRKKYSESDIGREKIQQFRTSAEGRLSHKNSNKRYAKTPNGRLANQQKLRRYRERKNNLDLALTNIEVDLIYKRFLFQCFKCESKNRLEIDHHYSLSSGHGLALNNAVLLCRSCNASKGNKDPEDFYTSEQLKCLNEVLVR